MTQPDGGTAIYDQFAERRTLVKIITGFIVAGILLYLLGVAVGWRAVSARLATADARWVIVACLSTFIGLVAWSKTWQIVLKIIGIHVPTSRLTITYLAATFANYVTPFGQAGGEPFIAYVLSQDTGASYEDSLASVVSTDLLNLLPFFNFAAIGFAVLVLRAELPDEIEPLAVGLTALAVAVPLIAYFGWNYRESVEDVVLRLAAPFVGRTKRASLPDIRRRIDNFYASLERVAADQRALAYALCFSYLGWVFFTLPLFLAAIALGLNLDILLVLFIVPASTIAGLMPTPGGLGGVETALVLLLVYLTTMTGGDAFAVATIYRVASYWFAILVGGIGAIIVIARA